MLRNLIQIGERQTSVTAIRVCFIALLFSRYGAYAGAIQMFLNCNACTDNGIFMQIKAKSKLVVSRIAAKVRKIVSRTVCIVIHMQEKSRILCYSVKS